MFVRLGGFEVLPGRLDELRATHARDCAPHVRSHHFDGVEAELSTTDGTDQIGARHFPAAHDIDHDEVVGQQGRERRSITGAERGEEGSIGILDGHLADPQLVEKASVA